MFSEHKQLHYRDKVVRPKPELLLPPNQSTEMKLDGTSTIRKQVNSYIADPTKNQTDIVGLRLIGDNTSFRVVETRTHKDKEQITEQFVSPKPLHKIGRYFSPKLHSERPAGTKSTDVQTVLVEEYDSRNEVLHVVSYGLADFYKEVDKAGVTKASWDKQQQEVHDPNRAIPIDITHDRAKGETAFAAIAEQLHEQGITNWAGLTWQQGKHTRKIVHHTGTRLRQTDDWGWGQNFSIVDIAPDGSETYLNAPARRSKVNVPLNGTPDYNTGFKDYELVTFLENQTAGPIRNMHMPQKSERAQQTELRAQNIYRYAGFLASPDFLSKRQEYDTALAEEVDAATNSRLLANRGIKPEDKPALWLLSYNDVLHRERSLERMTNLVEGRLFHGKERLEAVRKAVDSEGLPSVFNLVLSLKAELKQSLDRLGLSSITHEQQSFSWIVESIADRMLAGGDPFSNSNKGNKERLDIVDEKVGRILMQTVVIETQGRGLFRNGAGEIVGAPTELGFRKKHPLFREFNAYDKGDDKAKTIPKALIHGPLRDHARELYEKMAQAPDPDSGDEKITNEDFASLGRKARSRSAQ